MTHTFTRIELLDEQFRNAEIRFKQTREILAQELIDNENGIIDKSTLENFNKTKEGYYYTAELICEGLTMKFGGYKAGQFGVLHHFTTYEEEDGIISLIGISINTFKGGRFISNNIRLHELASELPEIESLLSS